MGLTDKVMAQFSDGDIALFTKMVQTLGKSARGKAWRRILFKRLVKVVTKAEKAARGSARRSSQVRGGVAKRLAAVKDQLSKARVSLGKCQTAKRFASAPARSTQAKASYDPSQWHHMMRNGKPYNGGLCGLQALGFRDAKGQLLTNNEAAVHIQSQIKCPAHTGIARVTPSFRLKMDMAGVIITFTGFLQKIAMYLQLGKSTLPSSHCCFHAITDGKWNGFTRKVLKNCCAKDSRTRRGTCNLTTRAGCMPLVKATLEIDLCHRLKKGSGCNKKNDNNLGLKCMSREPGSGATISVPRIEEDANEDEEDDSMELLGDDALDNSKVNSKDGVNVSWGSRRRRWKVNIRRRRRRWKPKVNLFKIAREKAGKVKRRLAAAARLIRERATKARNRALAHARRLKERANKLARKAQERLNKGRQAAARALARAKKAALAKARRLLATARRAKERIKKAKAAVIKGAKKAISTVKRSVVSAVNHVKSKLTGLFMKHIVPKAIKLIVRLSPAKYRAVVRKMAPHIMRGHLKRAIFAAAPILVRFLPVKYRPIAKVAIPSLIKGKIKKTAITVLARIRSLFLENLFATKYKVPILSAECALTRFVLPLVSMDYRVQVRQNSMSNDRTYILSNGKIVSKSGTKHRRCSTDAECRANPKACRQDPHTCFHDKCKIPGASQTGADYGSFSIRVDRDLPNGKNVCSFNFVADSFYCMNRQQNCCRSWAYQQPRFTNTQYQPALQTKGHDCKRWYLAVSAIAQSLWSIQASIWHTSEMALGGCYQEGCKMKCNPTACNSKSRCKWNPKARFVRASYKKLDQTYPAILKGKRFSASQNMGVCQKRRL